MTHRFVERLVAQGVVDLFMPASFYSGDNIIVFRILYSCLDVVFWVISNNHAAHQVLCLAQPAFLLIFQDSF